MAGSIKPKPQRIRDPLHNLIEFGRDQFEQVMWRVIRTRPFQRLRRIKQLGFSDLIYPGATHTRFAHHVGVFHTARQRMRIIEEDTRNRGLQHQKHQAEVALAAALVHDLGHGMFSHAFEAVGKELELKMAHHEAVSDLLICGNFHKATRGAEKMFSALMSRVVRLIKEGSDDRTGLPANHPIVKLSKESSSLENALALDDTVFWGTLPLMADASDPGIAEFAKRFLNRRLFKCIDIRERLVADKESMRLVARQDDEASSNLVERRIDRIRRKSRCGRKRDPARCRGSL